MINKMMVYVAIVSMTLMTLAFIDALADFNPTVVQQAMDK